MPYAKALRHAGGAAVAVLKATPAGKAVSAIGSLFGGKSDLRGHSLNALKRAIRSGDLATIERKALKSKYGRVRGIASEYLVAAERGTAPLTFDAARTAFTARKAAAAALGAPTTGAGPMQMDTNMPLPVSRAPSRRATGGRPRRRRRTSASGTRRRVRRAVRSRSRSRSRLKFGSPAWQRKYNPRARRRTRRR